LAPFPGIFLWHFKNNNISNKSNTKLKEKRQMATQLERIAVVETKVDSMIVCIDSIKNDVKDMHDCLDQTRDMLKEQLDKMYEASSSQHEEMSAKISSLEKLRDKWSYIIVGATGAIGLISGLASAHMDKVLSLLK
jgi:DNA polymerase sigma